MHNLSLTNKVAYTYDHLGNTRVVYSPSYVSAAIRYDLKGAYDYYPSGKLLRSYSANNDQKNERYLTTQHERDAESGYDFRNARFSDSEISLFRQVDPLIDKYVSWSPYNYVADNPVNLIDPTGKGPECPGCALMLSAGRMANDYLSSKNLSAAEKSVVIKMPVEAYMSRNNAETAERFARNSGLPMDALAPMHNNEADALRHSMWGALNTQTGGENFAREIGKAHEAGLKNNPNSEMLMDTYNNEFGIQIGLKYPDASPQELSNILLGAIEKGLLRVLEKNDITNTKFEEVKTNTNNLYDNGKTVDQKLYNQE